MSCYLLPCFVKNSRSHDEAVQEARVGVVKAGQHFENRHRELEQMRQTKQDSLQAKYRQGGMAPLSPSLLSPSLPPSLPLSFFP